MPIEEINYLNSIKCIHIMIVFTLPFLSLYDKYVYPHLQITMHTICFFTNWLEVYRPKYMYMEFSKTKIIYI